MSRALLAATGGGGGTVPPPPPPVLVLGFTAFDVGHNQDLIALSGDTTDSIIPLAAATTDPIVTLPYNPSGSWSGRASIVSLLELAPKRLKIDRKLVAPIRESRSQRDLLASIIDIGRSQGIEIVAEGVETMEHAAILRDLGCHVLQGYALARPMPASAMLSFLRDWDVRKGTLLAG